MDKAGRASARPSSASQARGANSIIERGRKPIACSRDSTWPADEPRWRHEAAERPAALRVAGGRRQAGDRRELSPHS